MIDRDLKSDTKPPAFIKEYEAGHDQNGEIGRRPLLLRKRQIVQQVQSDLKDELLFVSLTSDECFREISVFKYLKSRSFEV